jgi:hypothetical protein
VRGSRIGAKRGLYVSMSTQVASCAGSRSAWKKLMIYKSRLKTVIISAFETNGQGVERLRRDFFWKGIINQSRMGNMVGMSMELKHVSINLGILCYFIHSARSDQTLLSNLMSWHNGDFHYLWEARLPPTQGKSMLENLL